VTAWPPSPRARHRTSEFSGWCKCRTAKQGCSLDQAEPYGDCLTYGPGHYGTWAHWRRGRTVDPILRAIVRAYEYEDWPRGRIVFDRARDVFIIYADRKLMTPAMIARIATNFHLPEKRTEVKSDLHYQSNETPDALGTSSHAVSSKRRSLGQKPHHTLSVWKPVTN